MTDTPLSDDVVERVAMKLAMFMVDTWGDAEGVVWAGLSGQSKVKATLAARAALEAARYGEMVVSLHEAALQLEYLDEKFQPTGTTVAVLTRIRALLSSIGASHE